MKFFFFLLAIVFLIAPLSANAYIDPGTGSFIVQVIVATVLGAVFYFKFFWRKIRNFFKQKILGRKEDESKKI